MIFLKAHKLEQRAGNCSVAILTLAAYILARDHAKTLDLSRLILTLAANFGILVGSVVNV